MMTPMTLDNNIGVLEGGGGGRRDKTGVVSR